MLKLGKAFSSFSVDDLGAAKEFYGETLGLALSESPMGLTLHLPGGAEVFLYPKSDHIPATFTVLNFAVTNIDEAVAQLTAAGVKFKHYTGDYATDEKGIAHSEAVSDGPSIAWFSDPAGNILSVVE